MGTVKKKWKIKVAKLLNFIKYHLNIKSDDLVYKEFYIIKNRK